MSAILEGSNSTIEGQLGFKGETGDSAYEIAVKHGYTGTEAQWADDFLNAENYYDKTEADALLNTKANITNAYSSSTTDSYSCSYLNNKFVTVYSNATGSNTGVTLSQSIDTAKFCIVQYRQNGYSEASKSDIVFPGETKHQLSFSHRSTSGGLETLYTQLTYIELSGTTLSVKSSTTGLALNPDNSYGVASDTVYITKVIAIY